MRNKFTCIVFFTILSGIALHAQFVGINTTTPQATLDVKGTQRVGGLNNYIKYDSATGRIEWNGASLWAPVYQQIIKHSASSEGLYAGGGKLEYRNTSAPVFFSDWQTGNGYFSGNLGIGITTPSTRLHVFGGASGVTPYSQFAPLAVEGNGHTYINLLSPAANETAILFGSGTNTNGVLMYNNTSTLNGFQFRTNGNSTKMVIDNAGRVGIGTTSPQHNLHIYNGASGAAAPFGSDMFAIESSGRIDMAFLTTDASATEIWFSKPSKPIGGGIFYNSIPDGFIFRANNIPAMAIANTGYVGIGVNTPLSKFHVYGEESTPNGNAAAIQLANGALGSGNNNWFLRAGATGTNTPPGGFSIGDNNRVRFVIDNTGNIGIGTGTPQFPLDINGRMRLSGINPNDPGVWLNDAGTDRGFVGLQNNNEMGFYGNEGVGWGFTMNTISGALSVGGNSGSYGQVLTSNGSGATASWSNRPYAFTIKPIFYNSLNGSAVTTTLAGVDLTPFTLSQNSTFIYTLTLELFGTGPGTSDSKGYVVVEILDGASSRVSFASSSYYVRRSTSMTQTVSGVAINLAAGNYTIKARLVRNSPVDGDVDAHASLQPNEQGVQFIAQIIPN